MTTRFQFIGVIFEINHGLIEGTLYVLVRWGTLPVFYWHKQVLCSGSARCKKNAMSRMSPMPRSFPTHQWSDALARHLRFYFWGIGAGGRCKHEALGPYLQRVWRNTKVDLGLIFWFWFMCFFVEMIIDYKIIETFFSIGWTDVALFLKIPVAIFSHPSQKKEFLNFRTRTKTTIFSVFVHQKKLLLEVLLNYPTPSTPLPWKNQLKMWKGGEWWWNFSLGDSVQIFSAPEKLGLFHPRGSG